MQKTLAVISESYEAEWARSFSYSNPNSLAILARTVWPVKIPPMETVSKTEKGWKGDLLILFLLIDSFKKLKSKWALWPTKIALLF